MGSGCAQGHADLRRQGRSKLRVHIASTSTDRPCADSTFSERSPVLGSAHTLLRSNSARSRLPAVSSSTTRREPCSEILSPSAAWRPCVANATSKTKIQNNASDIIQARAVPRRTPPPTQRQRKGTEASTPTAQTLPSDCKVNAGNFLARHRCKAKNQPHHRSCSQKHEQPGLHATDALDATCYLCRKVSKISITNDCSVPCSRSLTQSYRLDLFSTIAQHRSHVLQ